jgi:hypothetical protein
MSHSTEIARTKGLTAPGSQQLIQPVRWPEQARNARPILGVPPALLLLAVAYTGFMSDSWLLRIP